MKNALIQGTRICEFVETQADQFPVAAELIWVEVADNTTTEDIYVDGVVVKYDPNPPSATIEIAVSRKLSELSSYRFEQETGGIVVSSTPIATSRESQALITSARIFAKENTAYTVNWKTSSGFVSFNSEQIITISDAVRDHVESCFDKELTDTNAINELTTIEDVDAYNVKAGW